MKNREKLMEYDRQYRKKNPEKVSAYMRKWRKKNKEKVLSYTNKWKQENPEKAREYMRTHSLKIRAARIAERKQFYIDNPSLDRRAK
jgi:ABC-type nitrate/sulfonate/bicarbonate transport system substrate-binding protein